jgi:nicotinamide mononucleotide transporter
MPWLQGGWDILIVTALAAVLVMAAWQGTFPYSMTETLGFVTGALCVYLVVKENVWNFPLGIANNVFLLILFAQARIYGDAALQIVYVALGVHGWQSWLYGGRRGAALKIAHAPVKSLAILALGIASITVAFAWFLHSISDAAPWLDAFTTVVSLAAQYLLNRKLIETWTLWIVADIAYIYLYLARDLELTAALYMIFLGLCVAGWWSWQKRLKANRAVNVVMASG